MKLFGVPGSPYVRKVRLVLEEMSWPRLIGQNSGFDK
jgi:glutathione S-transferase